MLVLVSWKFDQVLFGYVWEQMVPGSENLVQSRLDSICALWIFGLLVHSLCCFRVSEITNERDSQCTRTSSFSQSRFLYLDLFWTFFGTCNWVVFCCMWQKTMCLWMIFLPFNQPTTAKMTPSKSNHWLWMRMGPKYHTKDVIWTPQSIIRWHDTVIGLRWNPWHDAGIDVIARLVANNWSVLAMYGDVWFFSWWCLAVFFLSGQSSQYSVSNIARIVHVNNGYGPWILYSP